MSEYDREITDSFEIVRAIVHPESEAGKGLRLRGDLRAQLDEGTPRAW
jgi:hypothetical protein